MNKEKLEERLAAIEKLGNDWDSYGAEPVNKASIELARKIGEVIPDNWSVVPGVEGDVCFEHPDEGLIEVWGNE